ncbi:hypothetical protein MYX78_04880 [Acidobacteria bacterium AH-259-G07]|nr:hypothetical protein [Acidobacteria bacterium AH-259-G07]
MPILDGVSEIPGLTGEFKFPMAGGRLVPSAHIQVDPDMFGMDAHGLINALQGGPHQLAMVIFSTTQAEDFQMAGNRLTLLTCGKKDSKVSPGPTLCRRHSPGPRDHSEIWPFGQ